MAENPVRGYQAPRERNPRRPTATQDRYEAVRAVSDLIETEIQWGGVRARRRSYLSELLEIVNGTGRRLSPICALTYQDLRLRDGPHGAIRWPAATDKTGHESTILISPAVRRALDRVLIERPGSGPAPLFPSPRDRHRPMTRHLADKWLRRAEGLAGLEPQPGSLWHAYRRKWATERKHHPDVDVAAAGGWKTIHTLKTAYQQADQETMLRVVLDARELRERGEKAPILPRRS
jgi:integrase